MSANNRNQEKDESVLAESDDDFQYEEVSIEDDWSLTEGEEDLEATVKAIQDRAEASAAAAAAAAAPPPSPNATSITHQAEAVDDFLRNFLFQMGMPETLDCFQTEWTELVMKGLVDTERVGVVPDVYTENQRLDRELKNEKREGEEYRLAASAGAETLAKVQKDRDFHRLKHKRVVQEKNRLIEEMRKLKVQCDSYKPAVKRMNEKYQAVIKQTMLVTLEMDKALGQATRAQHMSFCGPAGEEGAAWTGEPSVKGTTHPVIRPRPPTSANSPRSQTRDQSDVTGPGRCDSS
ncbi:sperm-associated antigen 16 protein-like isoform X3 [Perca flavescens]|uniref:sperm-associated antigen 16 protein-like isoform X3 n=1 Tax=Perca flavescens TaxID=8167 RepID=UPI00106EB3E4|nr:sperm-associated antigen 16 protein-like isoform X3 [Perca flavescens]